MGDRIFLHCCCGPCTLYPLQALREEGLDAVGYFFNPNIHPYREFQSRLEAFRSVAREEDLPVRTEEDYGLADFMAALRGMDEGVYQAKSPERCRMCYRLRMEKTAAACRREGLEIFSTTLLVSPYQRHDWIRDAGDEAARAYGLRFFYRDFRPGFREGRQKARERGLYMQPYCGCVFSEYERFGGKTQVPARAERDRKGGGAV